MHEIRPRHEPLAVRIQPRLLFDVFSEQLSEQSLESFLVHATLQEHIADALNETLLALDQLCRLDLLLLELVKVGAALERKVGGQIDNVLNAHRQRVHVLDTLVA